MARRLEPVRTARFQVANAVRRAVADIDGKSFKLSDYRGKIVLLDFFAAASLLTEGQRLGSRPVRKCRTPKNMRN